MCAPKVSPCPDGVKAKGGVRHRVCQWRDALCRIRPFAANQAVIARREAPRQSLPTTVIASPKGAAISRPFRPSRRAQPPALSCPQLCRVGCAHHRPAEHAAHTPRKRLRCGSACAARRLPYSVAAAIKPVGWAVPTTTGIAMRRCIFMVEKSRRERRPILNRHCERSAAISPPLVGGVRGGARRGGNALLSSSLRGAAHKKGGASNRPAFNAQSLCCVSSS